LEGFLKKKDELLEKEKKNASLYNSRSKKFIENLTAREMRSNARSISQAEIRNFLYFIMSFTIYNFLLL